MTRIGSLFSGSGQLDRAVELLTGGEVVWHCEPDRSAAKVLAAHWPDVPNLGDVRRVNWSRIRWALGPVDVVCGGFPCTDISLAGRCAGMGAATQSGLWSEFARAVDTLRPGTVVIENVRSLLSVFADRHLAPHDEGLALRGMGAVLGDLADLGYDARWEVISAEGVGAPHRRERVFVVAYTDGR
jgi:DNA (cytosine-5)-methyltransferase 1